jgi:thiaminase
MVFPSCIAYTNFLIARAAADDIPVAIAVILPRFFLWHHLTSNASAHSKPYASNHCVELLGSYKSLTFHDFIINATQITNEIANDQSPIIVQRMEEAFIHSALFQWHFLQDILSSEPQRFAVWSVKDKPREVHPLASA